jgi:multicomponent Na+:H+ antiporter subunit G
MSGLEWLGAVLVLSGGLLGVIGGIGIVRFPDFYTRLHAVGVTDTLCAGLFLAGLACYFGTWQGVAKLGLILLFLLVTSPTASHAVAKSAMHGQLKPWQKGDPRR